MVDTEALRIIRVVKRESQEVAAKAMGISISSYSKKESGKVDFSISDIEAVKSHFELTWDEVIKIFFDRKYTQTEQEA